MGLPGTGTAGSRPHGEHRAPPKSLLRERCGPPDPFHPGAAGMREVPGPGGCGEHREQRSGFAGSGAGPALPGPVGLGAAIPPHAFAGAAGQGHIPAAAPRGHAGSAFRLSPVPSFSSPLPPPPAPATCQRLPRPPGREVPPEPVPVPVRIPRQPRTPERGRCRPAVPPPVPVNSGVRVVASAPVISDTAVGHSRARSRVCPPAATPGQGIAPCSRSSHGFAGRSVSASAF